MAMTTAITTEPQARRTRRMTEVNQSLLSLLQFKFEMNIRYDVTLVSNK